MSTQQDRNFGEQAITDQQVADYLREHPDFFEHHAALLATLQIPHSCGPAVSLVEYQISVLRDQNRDMRRKLKELVQLGRDNDRLSEHMLHLTEALIEARDLDHVVSAVEHTLRHEFHADAVPIYLFAHADAPAHSSISVVARDDHRLQPFDTFFKNSRPLCGRLTSEQMSFLFADQADELGSAALIPLGRRAEFGMLAIGSRDAERFHPGMGTLFLNRLSRIVGAALRAHHRNAADHD